MDLKATMGALREAGTAQNRKVYGRHGVQGDMFGVSYAALGKLKKKLGIDHALAESLWATGNHDARVLATMIADPGQLSAKTTDRWAKDLDNYIVTDAFAGLVAQSKFGRPRAEKWMKARGEWVASAGWNILSRIAAEDEDLKASYFEERLKTIESKIHGSKNRVRHNMNQALISIGIRSPGLKRKAVAAAKRIGKVDVDHGETSCKTPDAIAYIEKTLAHRAKKKTTSKRKR